MWGAIIGFVALIVVLVSSAVLYVHQQNVKEDVKRKLSDVVNQINDSQLYEYNFDKQQDENLKSVDHNVSSLYEAVVDAQKNLRHLERTAIRSDQISGDLNPRSVSTSKLTLGDKFSLVSTGPDEWLRLSNREGTNYRGGFAAAKIWTRDAAIFNGSARVNGSLEATGFSKFKGGVSDMNPKNLPTQFPNADGWNYIRGNTRVDGKLCIGDACLTPEDIRKLKEGVQSGTVYVELNCKNSANGQVKKIQVKFPKPYTRVPTVRVAASYIDWCNNTKNLRMSLVAENVTKTGFTAVLATWANTSMWSLGMTWIAHP